MHEELFSLFHSDFGISYIRFRMTRQANSKGTSSSSQIQSNSQYDHQFRSVKLWKKILFNFIMTAAGNI
jgi:hypothetical protein